MSDDRTDAEVEKSLKDNLIKNGMPRDLVNRAVDSWFALVGSSPKLLDLLEQNEVVGFWAQYAFMQGFVAGNQTANHHN